MVEATPRRTALRRRISAGVPIAEKYYSAADTAKFKCWGSGYRNEQIVATLLGSAVPAVVDTWSEESGDFITYRWVEGAPVAPGREFAVGALLGRIHSVVGPHWGSLDNRHTFADGVSALASRWDFAMRLIRSVDPGFSSIVERWGDRVLAALDVPGLPRLVHGDFGPANLLDTGGDLVALDWEHARWGHPSEDWAKMRLAEAFAEPNGFTPDTWRTADIVAGAAEDAWLSDDTNNALETFLLAYYAISLGVFFPGTPNARLEWVRRMIDSQGSCAWL